MHILRWYDVHMARKNGKQNDSKNGRSYLHIPEETKRSIAAVVLIIAGILLLLAGIGVAGPGGSDIHNLFRYLLGAIGYFLLPLLFFMLAGTTLREASSGFTPIKIASGAIFVFSGLGFLALVSNSGGLVGSVIADPAVRFFDVYASLVVLGGISL